MTFSQLIVANFHHNEIRLHSGPLHFVKAKTERNLTVILVGSILHVSIWLKLSYNIQIILKKKNKRYHLHMGI